MRMENKITILCDYKNRFSSKYGAETYRSGMDKNLLRNEFARYGISVDYMSLAAVDFSLDWRGKLVLYTSSEDIDVKYKSYIEDIVYGLELAGANVIPGYKYLKAHHNKVFMEILRRELFPDSGGKTLFLGTMEELEAAVENHEIIYPCVLKSAAGAMSKGVMKADNKCELIKTAKKLSATPNLLYDWKDCIRKYRHKGYVRESTHRNKFIVQPLIKDLKNDWKVLVYGDKIFVLKRGVRKNDFRASGSHLNYKSGREAGVTKEMLDYVYDIYTRMNVPMLSFDLAYDGQKCYMIEFQALYFGTSTFNMSSEYYQFSAGKWVLKEKQGSLEESFVYAICKYLDKSALS